MSCLYRVTFEDGSTIDNLTNEQVNEVCKDKQWRYVDTMEGIELKKMMAKLNKGERLKML